MWEDFHDDVHSKVERLVPQPQEIENSVFRRGPPGAFSAVSLLHSTKLTQAPGPWARFLRGPQSRE